MYSYRGFIEVCVGQSEGAGIFDVHESLLSARSSFFRNALDRKWKEGQDRRVKLPADEPDVFRIYVNYLYTGVLAVIPDPLPAIYKGAEDHLSLAKVYVLAEMLQDTTAKNAVVEAMLVTCRRTFHDGQYHLPGPQVIHIVYEGTPGSSPMRRVLVDLYTYRATRHCVEAFTSQKWPHEFYQELAICMMVKRAKPSVDATRTGDASTYMEKVEPKLVLL